MIALDTGQAADVWLESDAEKPLETRPTFVTRYLTARQWIKVSQLLNKAQATEDNEEGVATLIAALKLALVDWRNVPGEFDVDQLPDLLTFYELWDLVYAMLRAQQPGTDDRKNSGSRSGSNSEPPAETVPAAQSA